MIETEVKHTFGTFKEQLVEGINAIVEVPDKHSFGRNETVTGKKKILGVHVILQVLGKLDVDLEYAEEILDDAKRILKTKTKVGKDYSPL
jgi:hypothetical protein